MDNNDDDDRQHLDDFPDEPFEGFAPEHLGDTEWRVIKDMANKRLNDSECKGNYAKACVLSYFDFLDVMTEIPIKHH